MELYCKEKENLKADIQFYIKLKFYFETITTKTKPVSPQHTLID